MNWLTLSWVNECMDLLQSFLDLSVSSVVTCTDVSVSSWKWDGEHTHSEDEHETVPKRHYTIEDIKPKWIVSFNEI